MDPQEWRDRAACAEVGNAPFFVDVGLTTKNALDFCDVCPVRQNCLDYANDNHIQHGIWGGLTTRQRQRYRAEQRRRSKLR